MADQAAETYLEHRSLLFSIAYRMTGRVEEAEDITSEVFLRYRRGLDDGVTVRSPRAFLTTTVTRLSIDHLRSARHNRETYVGPWLPEPLVADTEPDVATRVEVADSLSMAFLVVLESLTPVERAAFLLREVFQYDYADIATIIDKTEVNCRQLVGVPTRTSPSAGRGSRRRPRSVTASPAASSVRSSTGTWTRSSACSQLMSSRTATVEASVRSCRDRCTVATVSSGCCERCPRCCAAPLHIEQCAVNGQPGAMVRDRDGALLNVMSIDIVDGQVQTVRSIINPDKLHHLGPLLDPRALTNSPPPAHE